MSSPPRPPSPDRDATLDAAWKAHSTELPPKHLDAAILAAAHREARTRPHAVGDDERTADARGRSRAWWGITAAGTIGAIAFGIVQLSPPLTSDPSTNVATDRPRDTAERAPPLAPLRDAPATIAEAQRPPSAESKPKPDALVAGREADRGPAPARNADPAPSAAPLTNAQEPSEPRQRRADAPEREASAASRADTLAEVPAAASRPPATQEVAAATPRPFPGAAPAPSALAAPASAPAAKLQVRAPAAWIERIRAFYVERRFADAARELNAFRDAYPDADTRLPADLSAWAATVKRE